MVIYVWVTVITDISIYKNLNEFSSVPFVVIIESCKHMIGISAVNLR